MRDTKLFETILGITTPWHVARVELKTEDKRVDLWLEHEPTRWPCPECGDVLPGFDHAEARTWRHLDTCQFQTHLHAEIPPASASTDPKSQASGGVLQRTEQQTVSKRFDCDRTVIREVQNLEKHRGLRTHTAW